VTLGALVITGALLTMRVSDALPVPPRLTALTAKLNVPVVVGVPVMRPVEEFTLSQPGRPEAE
jgi:hypothetical protein